MPSRLRAAATVPATWVPCPPSSTVAGSTHDGTSHGPSISGMSVVKLRDPAASKLGAMSGCEASTPVSMMPTRTSRPVASRWASSAVAPIMSMSHWRSARGSASAAPWSGRTVPVSAPAFRPAAAARSSAVGRSWTNRCGWPGSLVPTELLWTTAVTARSARTRSGNPAPVARARATSMPSFTSSTVPPDSTIARRTAPASPS
jgi:hypothetical protein